MASTIGKKPCATCTKGVAVTTCDGCRRSFCVKHFVDHRAELSNHIEEIAQEHDLLRQDLERYNIDENLFLRISTWEEESITMIRLAAETARADLRDLLEKNNTISKATLTKITNELQFSRESNDYTEIDIDKWLEQLKEFRKKIELPSTTYIDRNESSEAVIHLIKVYDQRQHQTSSIMSNSIGEERFDEVIGKGTVSDGNLVIKCRANSIFSCPSVYGANRYFSGTHHIRFRIEQMGEAHIFFGITSAREASTHIRNKSKYGWWCWNEVGIDETTEVAEHQIVRTNDEMTLTLSCDRQQIELGHRRNNRFGHLPVDINVCPFPWKIVVILQSNGDSVRILS